MEITIKLTDRQIDTLLSCIESQAAHATIQAAQGKRNWKKTEEYNGRLNEISKVLYRELHNAHEREEVI